MSIIQGFLFFFFPPNSGLSHNAVMDVFTITDTLGITSTHPSWISNSLNRL